MKKRIKQILSAILVAVMLVGVMPITSFAEDGEKTFGYLKYEISDGEVTIKDCDAAVAGKIEIPASIDGYPVTKIYPGAFGNCANITEFYIPESINSIHNTSFEGCSGVNKIVVDSQNTVYDSREDCNAIIETKTNTLVRGCHTTVIPESVTAIGSFAFNNVTSLKSIDISDKITSIGKSAFYGCSSLGGIHIPDSVTAIGDTAFYGCSKLRFADIGDGLKYIGYLAFAYCSELNDLTIGSSVEKIENSAFKGCSNLERINIPDSVTSIGDESFALCSKLTDVILGYGIKNMGWGVFYDTALKYVFYDGSEDSWNQIEMYDNTKETLSNAAFEYRNNLTEIIVPNSVKSIGEFAFLGCNNLSKIRLPDTGNLCLDKNTFVGTKYYNDSSNWENNVLYIGNHLIAANGELKGSCKVKDGTKTIANQAFSELFDSDIELTNIIFPETLERIGDSSFWGCNLEEVVIPNSVTYLGESAFWNNSYLKKVKISNNLNFVAAFGACDSLEEFAIPDGIEKIGSSGFVWCENLKTVTIPKSVTSIESKAFLGCKSLKDVYYSGSKEDWDKIVVEAENEPLLNATIHFNVSVHTHTLNHITVPSTCKVAGMEYNICTECGETLNEKTLPLAAHKWSDWTVVKEPTATTEGIEKRTCSVCGDSETRSIDKFNGIRDSETGVEIIYNDEYSDGTELKVEEKFSGKSFQLIDTAYGKTNTAIYDISTYKDGVKVQPNGEITVRVPLPKGFSANKVFVCYVDSTNGKVTKIPCEVKDGYVVFKTDHFSEYAVVEQLACVKSVSVSDISLNYKKSATIKQTIKADDGAKYTVKYSSSNTKVATVDKNGKVYGAKKGTATIICTVTDSNGNTVQDTCKVTVKYSFGQWLIVILLFGWIWY